MLLVRTGCFVWVFAAMAAAGTLPACAQYPGHVDEEKQQSGTHLRATAVLEYTGDLGKIKESRLVPIVVWDGAQYQPGGLYLAQPAPLAVLSGTQYELESAGKPKGFFNIKDAEDLAGLWIGVGSFEAPAAPKPKAPPAKLGHTYEVKDVDPDKPHFAHRPADEQSKSEAGASSPARTQNAPPVDPDRPTLHPRAGGDSDSAASGSTSNSPPDVDPDRPTFHRRSNASGEIATSGPPIDPDRPRLGYIAPVDQSKLDKPDALFGLPPDMNQIAGISDDRTGDTISWAYSWANPDDQNKMKAALETIAEQAIAPPPAPAATGKAGITRTSNAVRRKNQPASSPPPTLAGEDFRAYSLSFGGGATMVLSAHSTDTPAKYVTIVAQPDFYGKPKVLLKQVTTDAGLDGIPRLRLIDAVDTEGNGNADLVFELRGQTYRQFAIYRVAGGTATQEFVTQPTAN
jgi:hypothetical protein